MERLTNEAVKVDASVDRMICPLVDLANMKPKLLDVILNGPTLISVSNNVLRSIIRQQYSALAAYEDTGLTPGEIKSMQEEHFSGLEMAKLHSALMELKKYQEADKEGRLVVLPCKVGSTVYTEFCDKVVEKRIGQFHVNGYTEPRLWADIDCDWASTQRVRWNLAIGKTIFLTREEAEAALKEAQNGNKTDM